VRRRTGLGGFGGGVRRWWVGLSLLAGVVLLTVAVFGLSRDRPTPSSFGAAPPSAAPPSAAPPSAAPPSAAPPSAAPPSAAPPSAAPPSAAPPSAAPDSAPVGAVVRPPGGGSPARAAAVALPAAAPAARPARELAVPVRLGLPSLRVHAAVQGVVTTGGVLGVPDDPARVGWWTGSVQPGSAAGSTVLDGHVDSAVSGAGALFGLAGLNAGDRVSVTDARGRDWTYRVYARQVYRKHQGLPAALFATTGPARLVLITCGGPFNAATRSYQDNIVVFAATQP